MTAIPTGCSGQSNPQPTLKPCPLCGGNAVWTGWYLTTAILCQDCGLQLSNDDWDLNNSAEIRSKLAKKWNRRVNE